MQIAFYAPLKPPDHPVPSGERLMARLLIAALRLTGHTVDLVSRYRSFTREPRAHPQTPASRAEIERIAAMWQSGGMPDAWFCYHPYYKAPDLIGPELSERFDIPYLTAEASHAGKRDRDDWAPLQAEVARAVKLARVNFHMTPIDREGLARLADDSQLASLPAFIDPQGYVPSPGENTGPVRLVTTAMMRSGAKLESYRLLAATLTAVADADWHLTIIGDGPARPDVKQAFTVIEPGRLTWAGECRRDDVAKTLAASDIFVWPGIKEAYGLAYLEAQASGLPVAAMKVAGVPYVVEDGRTGLLVAADDTEAYGNAIRRLCTDLALRRRLGQQAAAFVHGERNIKRAADTLDHHLQQAVSPRTARS